jgi:hypothetical protein
VAAKERSPETKLFDAVIAFLSGANAMLWWPEAIHGRKVSPDWYAIKFGPWIWGRALELTLPMSAAVRYY